LSPVEADAAIEQDLSDDTKCILNEVNSLFTFKDSSVQNIIQVCDACDCEHGFDGCFAKRLTYPSQHVCLCLPVGGGACWFGFFFS
jgi:hypothetical protein